MSGVRPQVSICIPAYNGAGTLAQTLDSIVAQAFDGLEVVICDDVSQDDTAALAESYARRHPCIRVFRNEKNLGMDRNFAQSALRATGTYVWFCGQDDVFAAGAFGKFREICARHPDVDIIYFNYRFLNGDLTREVALPLRVRLKEDAYFTSAQDYFGAIDHAPTFLAATVMRRALWDSTPWEKFLDTHYVQMGVVLHNLAAARVYVVANPRYVVCRVPEDSWKLQGGQMLFEIHSGTLEVYDTVYHSDRNPLPRALYRQKMRDFLKELPIRVISFGELGFRRTPLIERRMRQLYGRNALVYWLYVWPLLHLPPSVGRLALRLHRSAWTSWIPRGINRLVSWLGSRFSA